MQAGASFGHAAFLGDRGQQFEVTNFELCVHVPAGESKRFPHSHESNSSFDLIQTLTLMTYR
jgi:hypothetical protein